MAVAQGRMKSGRQVDAAVSYIKAGKDLNDTSAFESACGIGMVVSAPS